jgi:hypothetical protein
MNLQSYPVGLAIKNGGGRKTKQNRHIRSERAKRRAFKVQSEKLICRFERIHGIAVHPDMFRELSKKTLVSRSWGNSLWTYGCTFWGNKPLP